MSYRKRAKAGWNSDKEASNRSERNYEKEEIEGELVAHEEPPVKDEKFVSAGKRTKKKQYKYPEEREIKKLTRKIEQTQRFLDRYEGCTGEWITRMLYSYRHHIKKGRAKLAKLEEKLQEKKEQE